MTCHISWIFAQVHTWFHRNSIPPCVSTREPPPALRLHGVEREHPHHDPPLPQPQRDPRRAGQRGEIDQQLRRLLVGERPVPAVDANTSLAGRYEVEALVGRAAFSSAYAAVDHAPGFSGRRVCLKVVKNNKDFFDQSLDEIKIWETAICRHYALTWAEMKEVRARGGARASAGFGRRRRVRRARLSLGADRQLRGRAEFLRRRRATRRAPHPRRASHCPLP